MPAEIPADDGWVPIWVPRQMARQVLRDVAAHIDVPNAAEGMPRDWGMATDEDRQGVLVGDKAAEWDLLVHLARADGAVPAAEMAAALKVEVDDVAGLVGPLNKRARRAGWVSPVQPRTEFRPKAGSVRGLVLHEALCWWVVSREQDREPADGAA